MSEQPTVDVLISGAGPVGLFLANELHHHGLSCRIIDKKTNLSQHSKALGLHARTLEVLMNAGYLDAVCSEGLPVKTLSLISKKKTLAAISFKAIDAPNRCVMMLPQSKTEQILHQRWVSYQQTVDWQHELVSFEQNEEQVCAKIRLPSGGIQTQTAHWIIGCDGAHSQVRHTLGFDFVGAPYQAHWWLVDCCVEWEKPADQVFIFFTKVGPLAFFPIKNNRYRLIVVASEKVKGEPSFDEIKKRVSELCDAPLVLSDPIWISAFSIHHRQVQQYQKNRAFLAGDAAHIHSPVGGQGLNTGLQDAYNLAWKLAMVKKHQASQSLLATYHAERYPVGKTVVETTDRMTKVATLTNPLAVWIRNQLISFFISIKTFRKTFASQMAGLSIHYRKSALTEKGGRFWGVQAGDLVPNMVLYEDENHQNSIFSCLDRKKFTLLYFSHEKPQGNQLEKLNAFVEKHHVVLTCRYITSQSLGKQVKQEGVLVVRPDQYVGLASRGLNLAEIEQWLVRILKGA